MRHTTDLPLTRFQHFIVAICFSFSIVSCTTAFVEQGEYGGYPHGGYKDVTTNANTAVVSFRGGNGDTPDKIRKYLMYRCAEVTSNNGYDYFVIVSNSMSSENINLRTKTTYKPQYPITGVPNLTYASNKVKSYGYSPTKSYSSPCGGDSSSICNTRAAVAVIKMFNGPVPIGLPRAYQVNDVLAHYGSSVSE